MRLAFPSRRRAPVEETELQRVARELAEAERAYREAGRRALAFGPGCPVAAAALEEQRGADQRREQLARRYAALTADGKHIAPAGEAVPS